MYLSGGHLERIDVVLQCHSVSQTRCCNFSKLIVTHLKEELTRHSLLLKCVEHRLANVIP